MRRDVVLKVSARQLTALDGAMRVAREEYLKIAGATPELEAQFRQQAADCSDLLEILDEAQP